MSAVCARGAAICVLVTLAAPFARQAIGQIPDVPLRLAFEDDGGGAAMRLAEEAAALQVPIAVRWVVPNPTADSGTEARLEAMARRRVPVWLSVLAPRGAADIDAWRDGVRALLARENLVLAAIEVIVDRESEPVAAFAVQVAATEARARHAGVRVALGGPAVDDPARRESVYPPALAPYVDLLVLTDADAGEVAEAAAWLRGVDPTAQIARAARDLPVASPDEEGTRQLVDVLLGTAGGDVAMHAWPAAAVPTGAVRVLARLPPLLTNEITALDAAAVGLRLEIGGRDVTAAVEHRLLFDVTTFATYLVYWGEPAGQPLEIALTLPIEGVPTIRDVLTGGRSLASGYARDQDSGRVVAAVPLTGRPMLVDFNEGASELLADRSEVTAERPLSVDEIISRHQQQQVGQDTLVRTYTAHAVMRQHFRPTITDPGYDIVTENRYFVAGDAVEWEELSFSVNGSTWGADRPPFPLLQPEKVLSLPLQLRFDEGYRYRLDGTEQVEGFDCYVVRFEPVRRDSALYRGTVWIDRRTFARVRVQAVQSGLAAPVVSNEETLRYVPVATIGERPVFLFAGMTARQILLIAGRNLLVEKTVTFSDFNVNDPEFDRTRRGAHESDRIMYRETDLGLRYFVKEDGTRVVSDRPTSSVKAMAMGVTLDPSYSFPLPMFGIQYLDFSFGSQETQLALLFAGVLAAGNIQRPKLGSTPLDASLDFFAIAVPSSDRWYSRTGEAEGERVLTWPMSGGINLGWQTTPFQKLSLQYQARFDAYVRDRTTDESFRVPDSTLTSGVGGAWEYRRGGYSVTLNGTWFARQRWSDWGVEGAGSAPAIAAAAARTYVKSSASVSRTVLLDAFQRIHVNAAWFGGRDLDRFSQYQFGMFDDTRIHGVPASGVRFGELTMIRGSYSLNVFEQYRLDLFLEHGWGRDEGSSDDWRRIPAVGTAVNVRAPLNTILRMELGKSFLPERYRRIGSTTLQVLLLKPLE